MNAVNGLRRGPVAGRGRNAQDAEGGGGSSSRGPWPPGGSDNGDDAATTDAADDVQNDDDDDHQAQMSGDFDVGLAGGAGAPGRGRAAGGRGVWMSDSSDDEFSMIRGMGRARAESAPRGRGRPRGRGGIGSRGGRGRMRPLTAPVPARAPAARSTSAVSQPEGPGEAAAPVASAVPPAAAPVRRGPGRPPGSGARAPRAAPARARGPGRPPTYFDAPVLNEPRVGPGEGVEAYSTPQLRTFPERVAGNDDEDDDMGDDEERGWPGTRQEASITVTIGGQDVLPHILLPRLSQWMRHRCIAGQVSHPSLST